MSISQMVFNTLIIWFFYPIFIFYVRTEPVHASVDNPIPASATRMPEWIDTTNLDTDLD